MREWLLKFPSRKTNSLTCFFYQGTLMNSPFQDILGGFKVSLRLSGHEVVET
jgi:hypothetical protein